MSSKGKLAQIFVIVVIMGLSLFLAAGIWKEKSKPVVQQEVQQESQPEAEMKLTDMEFTEMQEGKRFWTLRASEAKYFQDQQRTLLQAVRLTFYTDTGAEIHVQSREGVLHTETKDFELLGNVRAELPNEYVATMEKANYKHADGIVTSDTPVHVSGPGLELDGNRWQYKMADHVAKVNGNVVVSLVVKNLRLEK
jgi:LPS export ABC transporter protein LptC